MVDGGWGSERGRETTKLRDGRKTYASLRE